MSVCQIGISLRLLHARRRFESTDDAFHSPFLSPLSPRCLVGWTDLSSRSLVCFRLFLSLTLSHFGLSIAVHFSPKLSIRPLPYTLPTLFLPPQTSLIRSSTRFLVRIREWYLVRLVAATTPHLFSRDLTSPSCQSWPTCQAPRPAAHRPSDQAVDLTILNLCFRPSAANEELDAQLKGRPCIAAHKGSCARTVGLPSHPAAVHPNWFHFSRQRPASLQRYSVNAFCCSCPHFARLLRSHCHRR